MIEKRYEHFTANGKQFTKWFTFTGKDRPKWQITGKLKNEYRESDDAVRNNIGTGSKQG
jgi:hypothetical protein